MPVRLTLTIAILAVITLLLWITYGYTSTYRLFGSLAIASVFRGATALAAGALFVLIVVRVFFRPGFSWLSQHEPTQLQTGIAVTASTFIAVAAALAWFGVDLATILTTSALVTAIIGLSVQPLLGSLMSGLALQRTIRIGDGIVLGGHPVAVTSLDWRSVVARRADGASMVIPNSRLAAETLEVLPHDQPVRATVTIEVGADVAPHRVRQLVVAIVDDCGEVDTTRPIEVSPQAARIVAGTSGTVAYAVAFWVTHFEDVVAVEARILRRCWYAFRRAGFAAATPDAAPADDGDASPEAMRLSLEIGELRRQGDGFADRLATAGTHLHYDDGERIVVPERHARHLCVVAGGQVEEIVRSDAATPIEYPGPVKGGGAITHSAALRMIERALAARIGPYARHAVERAARGNADAASICGAVAMEIDDAAERAAFIAEAMPAPRRVRAPGFVFRCQRDSAGRLAPEPPLFAVGHGHVIAVPDAPGSVIPGASL